MKALDKSSKELLITPVVNEPIALLRKKKKTSPISYTQFKVTNQWMDENPTYSGSIKGSLKEINALAKIYRTRIKNNGVPGDLYEEALAWATGKSAPEILDERSILSLVTKYTKTITQSMKVLGRLGVDGIVALNRSTGKQSLVLDVEKI